MGRELALTPTREEYINFALSKLKFQRRTEFVSLPNSVGRVTAKELYSQNTLPNQATSAMDGIALRFEDLEKCQADTSGWQEGQEYVFSNTGVAIPTEYDTVVMIEDVSLDEANRLRIDRMPKEKGNCVNLVGKMLRRGEFLLPAHYQITPLQLGLLAAGGVEQLEVIARPRVAIIPTGNELVMPGIPVPQGKNVETNGLVLEALIREWGGEPRLYPIIEDDPVHMVQVLKQSIAQSDIVIWNGGSSKGRSDYTPQVLESVARVYVYEVAHGPGKHTSFAMAGDTPVVGLVGPSGGAELTAQWYVKPLICNYLKIPVAMPDELQIRLMAQVKAHVRFDFYSQIFIEKKENEYVGWPLNGFQASRAQMNKANAVLRIPGGVVFREGEMVTVELKVPKEYIQ